MFVISVKWRLDGATSSHVDDRAKKREWTLMYLFVVGKYDLSSRQDPRQTFVAHLRRIN